VGRLITLDVASVIASNGFCSIAIYLISYFIFIKLAVFH
jgi:hypothetical protein